VKAENVFRYIGLTLVVLSLFVGSVQSQEVESQPARDLAEPEYVLAQPPYTMNYQGYLTDSDGNPLDGAYDLLFWLYDDPAAGNLEWGPETHNNTPVTRGIFQVVLGSSVSLRPGDFNEALYLSVWVDGTEVTPRQPLRAVPYAFGLVPGAQVNGDPSGTNYALTVINSGGGVNDRGLYARGNKYGIYARGTNDVGLYASSASAPYAIHSENVVYSDGGYAGPDTYIWVPVHNAVLDHYEEEIHVQLQIHDYGEVRVVGGPSASGSTVGDVYIPLQLEIPYGRSYRLNTVRIYYKTDGVASLSYAEIMGRNFSGGNELVYGQNGTGGTSIFITFYEVDAGGSSIGTSSAPVSVFVRCGLPSPGSTVNLYGVRLQLESAD
jgi:hypothetical protein